MDKAYVEKLEAVAELAARYRAMEQDGTPRLVRGKRLHDMGLALDDALAELPIADLPMEGDRV